MKIDYISMEQAFKPELIEEYKNTLVAHTISVSDGNDKTGDIVAFSMTPYATCPSTAHCDFNGKKCYALQSYKQHPNVRRAWNKNAKLALNNLPRLEQELEKFLRNYTGLFFRIHVAGDFFSTEYRDMWYRIMNANPDTIFLAYTKAFGFFGKNIERPKNFRLFFSFSDHVSEEKALKICAIYGNVQPAYVTNRDLEGFVTCPGQLHKKAHGKIKVKNRWVNNPDFEAYTCAQCRLCFRDWASQGIWFKLKFLPH